MNLMRITQQKWRLAYEDKTFMQQKININKYYNMLKPTVDTLNRSTKINTNRYYKMLKSTQNLKFTI